MTSAPNQSCLNCAAPLTGHYCSECGQRDVPPYPTVRELASEAVAEFSGWDGRFLTTLRTLINKPGILTLEFLQGRRASYLSPLRLYLFASVAYFVVAAAAPSRNAPGARDGGVRLQVSADTLTISRPERVAEAAKNAIEDPGKLTAAQRDSALKDIEKAPGIMRPILSELVGNPDGFKQKVLQTLPKMLFVLLPLFALILALFYRGRRYPEHLYFAIHLHTYIFVALTIIAVARFARTTIVTTPVALIGMLSIPIYATRAFRKVYGGSIAVTLAKEMGIGAIYFVLAILGFIGLLVWVSIF